MTYSEMKNQLSAIADSFTNITNTLVSIYDRDRNIICASRNKMCAFCEYVRQDSGLQRRCINHDNQAFDICDKTKKEHRYYCHMGLVEVARPIVQDGIVLGYILFGQISDSREKSLPQKRICECSTVLDKEKLRSLLENVRVESDKKISSMSKILETSVAYILMNHIMSLKSGTVAYGISGYIKEHFNEKITSQVLCDTFFISRTTLFNISKEFFGCGITEYILRVRMERAKELLLSGEYSVGQAGAAVGIDDICHFSKTYSKYFSESPSTTAGKRK